MKSWLGLFFIGIIASFLFFLNILFVLIEKLFKNQKIQININKNIIIITGCDSGFGEMLAKRLTLHGFKVIATCLTKEGAERIQKDVALAVICNVTNPNDVANLAAKTEEYCQKEGAKVWALVNNAGIADGGALDWTSLDVYRRVMEVNFFGLVSTTKAILPFLKRNPGSRIINLSSVAGLVSGAGITPYFASKHAVEGLAKGLREELKPWDIHVCNVNPSYMRTPILTSGMNSAKVAFEAAPKEITSEYDPSFQEAHAELMNKASEDPIHVVNVLIDAITDKYPVMWYFPGYGSNFLRLIPLCGSGLSDFLQQISASKLRPIPKPEAIRKYR